MEPKQELSRYMRAIFEESAGHSNPHLSTAELIAYQKGTLDEFAQKQAQFHLLACPQCIEAFKDVSEFFAPAREDEPDTNEFEIRRQWHAFKQRFPVSGQYPKDSAVNKVSGRSAPIHLFWATAAGVLLALGGAGLWIGKYRMENQNLSRQVQSEQSNSRASIERLQDENRKLEERLQESKTEISGLHKQLEEGQAQSAAGSNQPFTNTQSFELLPNATFKSAEKVAGNKLVAPAWAKSFLLVLSVSTLDADNYSEYALDIFDLQGRLMGKRITGLAPDRARFNRFTVTLPRTWLKGGGYKLRLWGRTRSGWQQVAEYEMTVATR
jgi:hypothetical protein